MAKRRTAAGKGREGLPGPFVDFEEDYPEVARAYEALGEAVHAAGPLSPRERRLVKLALAAGGRLEGAVRSHARRGARDGIARADMEQVAVLAATTCGLPTTVAALKWIREELAG